MRRVLGRPASSSREFDGAHELLDLLEKIEALRERLCLLDRKLAYLLANGRLGDDPYERPVDVVALQRAWHAFVAAGGVSADDLRAFIRGEHIGPAAQVIKKHLRLVSRQPQPIQRRMLHSDGNDAA
jgi:hypothetical protein